MKKKVTEIRWGIVFGITLLLAISFGCAVEDSWDSFSDTNNSSSDISSPQEDSSNNLLDNSSLTSSNPSASTKTDTLSSDGAFRYTWSFYTALVIGGIGVVIVVLLVLSFVLKPKNRWNKPTPRVKTV